MPDWVKHVDGFVCGDVGVFPFHFGSWEVWDKIGGEWQEREGTLPFKNIEEAKQEALHGTP